MPKNIKITVLKQLKRKGSDWERMTKKEEKELAHQVMQEAVENHVTFLKSFSTIQKRVKK